MPYKSKAVHRASSRKYYWNNRTKALSNVNKHYHQNIGTWTARRLGLTKEDYDRLSRKQLHRCAICRRPERIKHQVTGKRSRLAVDHNHKTKVIRGLLCRRCNSGLSLFGENPVVLRAAARYLRKTK